MTRIPRRSAPDPVAMIERLALPAWDTPPRPLDDWVAQLVAQGQPAVLARESSSVAWLEIAPLRLRGYAVLEGPHVTAIHFELSAPDPSRALETLEIAIKALGWELHDDDEEDDREDDEVGSN